MSTLQAFLTCDLRRVARDQFLIGLLLLGVAMAVGVRFALPAIREQVESFDLSVYYPLMVSYMVVGVSALMAGSIGGFLLLETREEGTIRALAITPVPLAHYLRILGGALVCLALVLALSNAALIGLGLPGLGPTLACAVVGALFAPAFTYFVAGFASNKVEAFAVMKISGSLGAVPLGAYFVAEPYQWLFSLYPPYMVCKAWWVAFDGGASWALWLLGGVGMTALYLWLLGRHFSAVAARS